MNTQKTCLVAAMLLVMAGCSKNDNPTMTEKATTNQGGSLFKGSGPSASGQGRIVGTDRVFAFNATTRPDGGVNGEGQLTYTHSGNSVRIHFTIDCLSVSGNVATMSGTVTSVTGLVQGNPSAPVQPGGPCWFRVKDNGEGRNASPDEMTGFLLCDPNDPDPDCALLTCGNDLGLPLNPIENGNIQVRP